MKEVGVTIVVQVLLDVSDDTDLDAMQRDIKRNPARFVEAEWDKNEHPISVTVVPKLATLPKRRPGWRDRLAKEIMD